MFAGGLGGNWVDKAIDVLLIQLELYLSVLYKVIYSDLTNFI